MAILTLLSTQAFVAIPQAQAAETLTFNVNGGAGTVPTSLTLNSGAQTISSGPALDLFNNHLAGWGSSAGGPAIYTPNIIYSSTNFPSQVSGNWVDTSTGVTFSDTTLLSDINLASSHFYINDNLARVRYNISAANPLTVTSGARTFWLESQAGTYQLAIKVAISKPTTSTTNIKLVYLDTYSGRCSNSVTPNSLNWESGGLACVGYKTSSSGSGYGLSAFSLAGGTSSLSYTSTGSGLNTLYAIWENLVTVTGTTSAATATVSNPVVTFIANGGSGTMDTQTSTSRNIAAHLRSNTFTNSGFAFTGWNTLANGLGQSFANGASFNFRNNMTLYAQWATSIAFDSNGASSGSAPTSISGTPGQSITLPTNTGSLAKTGLVFYGWNAAADGLSTTYLPGASYTIPSGGATLYAMFTAGSNRVSYSSNSATGGSAPADHYVNSGESFTVASNSGSLVRTGYTFTGWNTQANGSGTTYAEGSSQTTAANLPLFAAWSGNDQSIQYLGNGSTNGSMASETRTTGSTFTAATSTFTNTGKTFKSWNTAADGTGTEYAAGASITTPPNNLTLYAQWNSPAIRTLTVDCLSPKSVRANIGDTIRITMASTCTNVWEFENIRTYINNAPYGYLSHISSGNGKTSVDLANLPGGNYVIGTGSTTTSLLWALYSDGSGTTFINAKLEANTRDGIGKSALVPLTVGAIIGIMDQDTLASVKEITWAGPVSETVSYGGNSSTGGSVASQSWDIGEPFTLAANGFTRAGYSFTGWNTKADGTGTDYAVGASYTMTSGGLALFAKWSALASTPSEIEAPRNNSTRIVPRKLPVFQSFEVPQIQLSNGPQLTIDGTPQNPLNAFSRSGTGTIFNYENSRVTITAEFPISQFNILTQTLQVNTGGQSIVRASGFTSGTTWILNAFSTPTELATGMVGVDGNIETTFNFTENLPLGIHVLQFGGVLSDYTVFSFSFLIEVRPLFAITYAANSATSGTTPGDQIGNTDSLITLASNSGNLARKGYSFAGWNTAPDGTGTDFAESTTVKMPLDGLKLFAKWNPTLEDVTDTHTLESSNPSTTAPGQKVTQISMIFDFGFRKLTAKSKKMIDKFLRNLDLDNPGAKVLIVAFPATNNVQLTKARVNEIYNYLRSRSAGLRVQVKLFQPTLSSKALARNIEIRISG